jgi:DNA-directed RNA polymerase specialized sigma subunit
MSAMSQIEIQSCLLSAKNGDQTARNKIILAHLPFTKAVVHNYMHLLPNDFSSLEGVGLLALCMCVNELITQPDKWELPIKAILATRIKRELIQFISENQPIKITRYGYSTGQSVTVSRDILFETLPAKVDCPYMISEIIEAMSLTKRERLLLWYLLEGYSQEDVVQILNVSSATVSNLRQSLRGKMSEYLNDNSLKG